MTTLRKIGSTVAEAAVAVFATTRDGLVRARDALQAKRREAEAADAALNRLIAQRAPDAEVLPALDHTLEPIVTAWREGHGTARMARLVSLDEALGPFTWAAAFALVPAIREGLARAIASVPDGDGSPLKERVRQVAEQTEHKAAIDAQHAAYCDEASKLGITLEHLEATRDSRLADLAAQEARARTERDLARRVRG
jgi:hypothetical protein